MKSRSLAIDSSGRICKTAALSLLKLINSRFPGLKHIGKSYAQLAFAWLRQQLGVISPIVGAKTIEQLEDNLGSAGWDLTSEKMNTVDKVSQVEEGYPYRFVRSIN